MELFAPTTNQSAWSTCISEELNNENLSTISITSWNVNGVRARLELLKQFLDQIKPDALLLQEIKCQNSDFPTEEFKKVGYNSIINGQNQYNGVAILYKTTLSDPTEIKFSLPRCDLDEARYIECLLLGRLRISNLYVPNGSDINSASYEKKLHFLSALYFETQSRIESEPNWVIIGDFNIIPRNIDTNDKSSEWENTGLANHEVRKFWRRLINQGWTDIGAKDHKMTWEDYRDPSIKLRIDHAVLSPGAADALEKFDVLQEWRHKKRPSDHSPLILTLDMSKPKIFLNKRWWHNPIPDALAGLTKPYKAKISTEDHNAVLA